MRYDVRRDEPYSVYPELEFDVPVGTGEVGHASATASTATGAHPEMQESIKILRQCFEQIPDGPVIAKVPRKFKPPPATPTFGSRARAATWAGTR